MLSGVGAAVLAALAALADSNADRAPALVRDLCARAVYSGVGLDVRRVRDDEATDQSGDVPPLAVLIALLRARAGVLVDAPPLHALADTAASLEWRAGSSQTRRQRHSPWPLRLVI